MSSASDGALAPGDEVKANLIVAILRVVYDQLHGLQGNAVIQKLVEGKLARQAERAADHDRQTRNVIIMMLKSLEPEVVANDGLGSEYRSLDELVFRACRLVLSTQICYLQAVVDGMQPHMLAHLSQDTRSQIDRWLERSYILSFLQVELRNIDQKWIPYRSATSERSSSTTVKFDFYRAGLALAEFAIRELGRNQVVAKFFRDGAYLEFMEIRRRSEPVLGILELEINPIPDDLIGVQQLGSPLAR